MQAYKQITDEITLNQQFKTLTQAYQEHAIVQINLARYSVVASREFMDELADIFYYVKKSYELYLKSLTGEEKEAHKEKIKKNGKTALILLSANGKFYGDLVTKVCRLFIQQVKADPTADIIIVGAEGRKFYESAKINKPFIYIDLPDTTITLEMLQPLISTIIGYQKSMIFYGKFNNIIVQDAVEGSISGDMPVDMKTQPQEKEDFLFEPNVEFVMEFFENQIFSMLLSQTVSEGKLARFASRIKAMEAAQSNLLKQLGYLHRKSRRIKSMEANKKQLQLFAGRALWNKR